MKITIINRTEFIHDRDALEGVCDWLGEEIDLDYGAVSLVFVDDGEISRLNEKFYHREGITDVLAFPYEEEAEIFLNPYQHRRQASEFGNSFSQETVENIIHALLHLAGYDHTEAGDRQHLKLQKTLMGKFEKKETGAVIAVENETGNSGEM